MILVNSEENTQNDLEGTVTWDIFGHSIYFIFEIEISFLDESLSRILLLVEQNKNTLTLLSH